MGSRVGGRALGSRVGVVGRNVGSREGAEGRTVGSREGVEGRIVGAPEGAEGRRVGAAVGAVGLVLYHNHKEEPSVCVCASMMYGININGEGKGTKCVMCLHHYVACCRH